ncbi:MAG: glutamate--tRNA ligase [Alphaproteobacteria bacterium]
MSVAVRFAPSPTGWLHVGNARIALVNWLFARKHDGRFLLRIDDTDSARSRPEYERGIDDDLVWMGFRVDARAKQSENLDRYTLAAERLKAAGRLYPCYETPHELEMMRRRQALRREQPRYDRSALALTAAERNALESEGLRPHWRFLLGEEEVRWQDLVRGDVALRGDSWSDPILVREDGRPLFALTAAVDDLELGITHVIRGEDHIATTAAQIQIMAALGADPPAFAHLPLLADASGKGLSKRLGSLALRDLRGQGLEAMALNSYLARLGSPDPIEPALSLDDLALGFELTRISRARPTFDPAELWHLNAKVIHRMPFEMAAPRLAALGLERADSRFWAAVRPNLARIEDARRWYEVCWGSVEPVIEDREFTATAADLLPEGEFDAETWGRWTGALKGRTGRAGRALVKPLRLALTGAEHGPELKELLPLIGRERALARLLGRAA